MIYNPWYNFTKFCIETRYFMTNQLPTLVSISYGKGDREDTASKSSFAAACAFVVTEKYLAIRYLLPVVCSGCALPAS
jgi:hypothetical protein